MDSKDIELLKLYGVVYTEPVSTSCACCTTTTTTQGLCCITRTCIQGLGMVVTNSEPWNYVDTCDIGLLEDECTESFQHPNAIGQVVQDLGQCQESTSTTTTTIYCCCPSETGTACGQKEDGTPCCCCGPGFAPYGNNCECQPCGSSRSDCEGTSTTTINPSTTTISPSTTTAQPTTTTTTEAPCFLSQDPNNSSCYICSLQEYENSINVFFQDEFCSQCSSYLESYNTACCEIGYSYGYLMQQEADNCWGCTSFQSCWLNTSQIFTDLNTCNGIVNTMNLTSCITSTTTTETPSTTTTTETPTTTTAIFTCPDGYNSCGSIGGTWIVDSDCEWSFVNNEGCPSGCESFHITWPDLAVNDCVSTPPGTIDSGRCCTPTTTTTGT